MKSLACVGVTDEGSVNLTLDEVHSQGEVVPHLWVLSVAVEALVEAQSGG